MISTGAQQSPSEGIKLKHVWQVWQAPNESSFNVTSWENWENAKHKVLANYFASVLCELEGSFNHFELEYKDGKFKLEEQKSASHTDNDKSTVEKLLTQSLELYNHSPLAVSFDNLKKNVTEEPGIDNLAGFFSESSSSYSHNSFEQRQRKNQKLVLVQHPFGQI